MAARRPVTIYADLVSQPSRALVVFCRAAGIPHEVKITRIARGEHRTPEFRKLNPLAQLPVAQLWDGEEQWALAESHAILKQLCLHPEVPEHWYPESPRVRGAVDAALDVHHTRIRRGCAVWAFAKVMGPLGKLPVPPKEVVDWHGGMARRAFKDMELMLEAAGEGRFVAGTAEPTIADLSIACELQQLEAVPGADDEMRPTPRVLQWMSDVKGGLQPHWDEVGSVLTKVRAAAEAQGLRA